MPISNSLQRLLNVLKIQEEIRKRDLTEAEAALARVESTLEIAGKKIRRGGKLIASAMHGNDLRDRLSGQVEIEAGKRWQAILQKNAGELSAVTEQFRAEYLDKRVERQQVETLANAAESQAALEGERRSQQSLDDWFLRRQPGEESDDVEGWKIPQHQTNRKIGR